MSYCPENVLLFSGWNFNWHLLGPEFKALPQLKPLFRATIQKLQQGTDPQQMEADNTDRVEKEN